MPEPEPQQPSQAERIRPYRWRPGQSGNPNGRPKGESIVALLRRVLEQEHNGKLVKEVLAERIVKEALSGKFPFAKELLDRLEGLPGKEKHTNEPVRIIVADYRTGAERPGTHDDIRNAMAPIEREGTADDIRTLALGQPVVREFTKLRDFYTNCPAPVPPGFGPQEGGPHEGGSSGT